MDFLRFRQKGTQSTVPTVAMKLQFNYFDCSKIMLAPPHTKCIFHDFFVYSIYLHTYWLILIKRIFKKC